MELQEEKRTSEKNRLSEQGAIFQGLVSAIECKKTVSICMNWTK